MSVPAFAVNDVVYLRESAGIGILEAVKISGIRSHGVSWVYSIQSRSAMPDAPSVYGDRISHVNGQVLYFNEDELISQCQALTIMEDVVSRKLVQIQSMRQNACNE